MSFLWPQGLWLLAVLPALPGLYVWLLRRQRRTVRYSSVALVRQALRATWRRHLPPALVLAGCAVLALAMARPSANLTLPWARTTVILAIDSSLSMRVNDVKPTRMEAAQAAARLFLRDLPGRVEVGLVTFAGNAQVVQRATRDRPAVLGAIDAIQMQIGTAVGDAIVLSLAQLFPEHGLTDGATPKPHAPVAPGSYAAAAIILLSDGRRTVGRDTLEAARLAADRGVRIFVVGLGVLDGEARADDELAIYLRLDEPTLREVARLTGGEYHHADTADQLNRVYAQLGTDLQLRRGETELTPLLALLGAVLMTAAAALSALWFGGPVRA